MCGRYVSTKSTADLLDEFDAEDATEAPSAEPDYNVAPTTSVRAVMTRARRPKSTTEGDATPVRQLRLVRWGLVPSWAKDVSVGNRFFNARSDSLATKPAFKRAFAKRRCLLPADGWYEWMRDVDAGGHPHKQPYLMTPQNGRSVALAGLYEFWRPDDAPADTPLLVSATIVTVDAQGPLAEIHERMPLVISAADWTRWLDPAVEAPLDLLAPRDEVAAEQLEVRPVSSLVNNVKNNSPELLTRAEPPETALELF